MHPAQIRTLAELLKFCRSGKSPDLLFFWGHTPKHATQVDKSCLSNWYPAGFESQGHLYPTSEHFLMAQKAWIFGDLACFDQIRHAPDPASAKKLGRQVKGFDEKKWLLHRWDANLEANLEKFRQNLALQEFLLQTGNQILVEASPEDKIWGIGLSAQDERAQNPEKWKGLNLLGFALMEVRSQLLSREPLI
ncbi:DUF1768 domain-containing protein [bacterium (Candidatus Blackallbacteria) CG17_big_fil_post_rev_8_21_14_2_50_48_46]|uniref:DUF1768 domain-containing protein n=1 Tax=bacterium (Candidatus Blackallbacteria) CG17_big_fil_post_rev_8_21_14_2_50_48_46 TaxID=2014261 RepID=A0A2M7G4H6_9BACT|nr:MAG: hypothetical protein COW64_18080 [bacterium (Candidatus Blackallbacteria) CG18_big_fil_WC_8_21_14_2_50_49_26]PIW16799.1 MAG: DUF1768 domain-containing protein [bacterium (Candidatus Blackallbacteria) CG17_big_fil_post_rev_8_21_14_2_50_48_46]PIW47996.1 MAG: DUF1768 domain-containing protein [bacterium (Candidatus Blackallbacteria) CG13_big_fil_rev_8_21_14_2_50_49_14]